MILISKFEEAKGILLEIQNILNEDNEEDIHNEMIVYLYPKKISFITKKEILNYDQLLTKNVFYLKDL